MLGGKILDNDNINYKEFLEGNNKGFENLVIKYKDNLIFFILKYIKDINLAEDIAQDAFVEVYVHKERYNFKTSFKTYLFTIGRNKAIDYIRKYSKEQVNALDNQLDKEENAYIQERIINKINYIGPEESLLKNENNQMLYSALNRLKEDYSRVIHLIDLEGLSYNEAGKVMKKTVPQIKVLIHRARKSLEKILREEGFIYENR